MAGPVKRVLSKVWWPWGQGLTPSSSSTVLHTPQTPARVYSSAVPNSTSTIPDPPPPPHFMRRAIDAIQLLLMRPCLDDGASSSGMNSGAEISDCDVLTGNGWLFKVPTYSRERVNEWRKHVDILPIGMIHEEDEPVENGPAFF